MSAADTSWRESGYVWNSVTMTHVQYQPGDIMGLVLAWSSLLPIFIFVSVVTLVLFRRDLHTICFGGGLILNELLNKILKTLIAEPRMAVSGRITPHSYAMPSDHAMYMSFFALYVILFLCIRTHRSSSSLEQFWKFLLALCSSAASAICCYSRVYLLYHTTTQVYWGVIVGSLSGCFWFFIVHIILTPYFSIITSWTISEFLMIRDYTLIPNTIWFEYCQVRAESRARQRKQNTRSQ